MCVLVCSLLQTKQTRVILNGMISQYYDLHKGCDCIDEIA